MSDIKEVDVLIIGAGNNPIDSIVLGAYYSLTHKSGISGIYAGKTYLDLHPHAKVVILDRDNCVGGTWNASKSCFLAFVFPPESKLCRL